MTERPRVVLLVGLPASGKSTWVRSQGAAAISSDEIRYLLSDDATNQNIHREVFATARQLLRRRLELKRPLTFVDATNITVRDRRPWIVIAHMYGARAEAVFFDTPAEVCAERNRARDRVVPDTAIEIMAARLEPPTVAEGLEAVTVYRPSQPPTKT